MVCVTCLVWVGASCGVRTRYYSLEGWCDSGFTNDAWRAVMLAGLDSGVESLTAHVCIGRLRRPRELFPLPGGSAVLNMDCAPESQRFSGHNANQRFDYNTVWRQPTAAWVLVFR